MKCNNCNNIIPVDSKFCKFCGAQIAVDNSTIKCPNPECGHSIPADSKFCPDCGCKVSALAETKTNVVTSKNDPQENPLDYLFPYIDKGRVGFKSLIDNNIYIPAKYEEAREFHEGFAAVKTNGKWGYMDKSGKWVLPAKEEWVEDVKEGVAFTGTGNRYKAGDCLMNFWSTINWKLFDTGRYTSHSNFEDGICQVWNDGKYHYSSDNEEGEYEILLPWRKHFDGGTCIIDVKYVAVRKNNLYGIIKLDYANDGDCFDYHEIIPCKYHNFDFTIGNNEIVISNDDGKLGVINIFGKEILPMEYDVIGEIKDGLIPVAKNGKIGYLDMQGNERIPVIYEPYSLLSIPFGTLDHFINGLVKVRHNNKVGLLDTNGNIVIPFMYDEIKEGVRSYFQNGLMVVCKNGIWGCVDSQNNIIIDFTYEDMEVFENGKSFVKKHGKWGMIDIHENVLIPIIYDELSDLQYPIHNAIIDGEEIIIDDNDRETDYEMIKIDENVPNRILVKKNGLWGMLDCNNNIIHECIFSAFDDNDIMVSFNHLKMIYNQNKYELDLWGNLRQI